MRKKKSRRRKKEAAGWDGMVCGTSGEISSAITKIGEVLWAGMVQLSLDSTAEGLLLTKLPRDL